MEEELLEAEVVWPEGGGCAAGDIGGGSSRAETGGRGAGRSWQATRPVEIPRAGRGARGGGEEDEDEDWTPPHLLASRRRQLRADGRSAAFSLCSGHGRTLKGRDLRHVRDSVLRMTGFLEG